jgi:hypothetical protein
MARRYRRRASWREAAIAALAGLVLAAAAHGAGGSSAGAATAASANSNVALGKHLAAAEYGWTGRQWRCLNWLWTRESGWRLVWNTEGSGAYGIPQALPASKMASAGADYMTNPATEIRWGLGYITGQYGAPCRAWSHEQEMGWY